MVNLEFCGGSTSFPGSLIVPPLERARDERPWERGCCGIGKVSISTFGMQILNKHARDPLGRDNEPHRQSVTP